MKYSILLWLLVCSFSTVWSQSDSMSLRQALLTVQGNNPELVLAQYGVAIAEADSVTAGLRPNPALNNQTLGQGNPALYPIGTKWYSAQNRQLWWQLTKPFQLPAQRKLKLEVAHCNVNVAQNQLNEIERNAYRDITVQWLKTWSAQKHVDLLEQALGATDSILNLGKGKPNEHKISEVELMRIQLALGNYTVKLRSAIQVLDIESARLATLVGKPGMVNVTTSDRFITDTLTATKTLKQPEIDSRSDIVLLQSTVEASRANVKLQRSMAWPQPELGVIYNPQNTIPYFGFFGTIEIPVFSRNQGEIQKSKVIQRKAEEDLTSTREEVSTELMLVQKALNDQQKSLNDLTKLLEQSERLFIGVSTSYNAGTTTVIDYLDAQRSLLEMRELYVDAMRQYKESYVGVLFVSGTIEQLSK